MKEVNRKQNTVSLEDALESMELELVCTTYNGYTEYTVIDKNGNAGRIEMGGGIYSGPELHTLRIRGIEGEGIPASVAEKLSSEALYFKLTGVWGRLQRLVGFEQCVRMPRLVEVEPDDAIRARLASYNLS